MSESPRTVSGKWIILVFLVLALALASGAWEYYYRLQQRPLALWGAQAARLIIQAPEVEGWLLADANAEDKTEGVEEVQAITIGSRRLRVVERRELGDARGLLHLRKALMNDRSFDWDAEAPKDVDWRYGLKFAKGSETATVLFAPQAERVRILELGNKVSVAPIARGLEKFFQEQFPEAKPSD